MNYPKTQELIQERLNFLDTSLKCKMGEKQKSEFEFVRWRWRWLQKALNGDRALSYKNISTVENITIHTLCSNTIISLLKFQQNQRSTELGYLERQERIQNQPFEQSIKMSAGEFIDFKILAQSTLDKFDSYIREIRSCLDEMAYKELC